MSDWEKKAAVQEVLNGYSGAAARLDIDEYMSFFVEDAEFYGVGEMMGVGGPFIGHDAIRAFFGPAFGGLAWLMQQNTTTNIAIGPDGRTAKASTGLVEMAKGKESPQIVLQARYDDELVLTDGGWKFKKRTLTPYRFEVIPDKIG